MPQGKAKVAASNRPRINPADRAQVQTDNAPEGAGPLQEWLAPLFSSILTARSNAIGCLFGGEGNEACRARFRAKWDLIHM